MYPTRISISKEEAKYDLEIAVTLAFDKLYEGNENAHVETTDIQKEWDDMQEDLAFQGHSNGKVYVFDLSTEEDALDQDFEVWKEGSFYEFKIAPIH